MDFELTDEQRALQELTARILGEKLSPERLREIERDEACFAREAWDELARAGLVGAALPEEAGGGGLGLLEACLVLEEIGKAAAPLPYLADVVLAGMTLAAHGTPSQKTELLPGVCEGRTILTAALAEEGHRLPPPVPATRAERAGKGWKLRGEKLFVPAAHLAARILVPAATGGGACGLFLAAPDAPGLSLERVETTSLEPQFHLRLDGAEAEPVGDSRAGAAVVEEMVDRGVAALCALQAGVCEGAIRMTAKHVSEREQFGTKIGTFQAVAHRAADAYVDTAAVTLTARQAAWRLSAGLPAAEALAVAKFWAADGGFRVAHAAQHLHGGLGFDTDYPVHRHFRWTKMIELTLGSAADHLLRLGDHLAACDA